MTDAAPAPVQASPFWKNPFVIALGLGILTLSILPFLQRSTLRAPPPLAQLPSEWSLARVGGGEPLSAATLKGKVWIAQVCVSPCKTLEVPLGGLVRNLDDVKGKIELVTVVVPGALQGGEQVPPSASPQLHVVTGTPQQVELFARPLVEGLARQPKETPVSGAAGLAAANKFILVDQEGAVRGFWKGDELGKGNVINAARMLSRYGPNP